MALEIIKHRQRVQHDEYYHDYRSVSNPNAGYSFPCNEDGELIIEQDNPGRKENYVRVWQDTANYNYLGVKHRVHTYVEPGEGKCKCGRVVYLNNDYGHGIDCECGRIYNMSGQELAPRSQWDDRYDDDDLYGYNVRFGYSEE